MHTALVSRLLRDRSLWEETTEVREAEELEATAVTLAAPSQREA
jgi:hypothetical protein